MAPWLWEGGDGIGAVVDDVAAGAGVLEDRAEDGFGLQFVCRIADDKRPAEGLRAGFRTAMVWGWQFFVDEEAVLFGGGGLRSALGHGHRFGGGGGFIEQRGVRDVEAGEVGDHGLEVDDGFETALADLRLVGRVGGVPGGIFEDVALDDGGR